MFDETAMVTIEGLLKPILFKETHILNLSVSKFDMYTNSALQRSTDKLVAAILAENTPSMQSEIDIAMDLMATKQKLNLT